MKTEIENKLSLEFKYGVWGGFEIGYGEFFTDTFLSDLKRGEICSDDFIVFTEKVAENVFESTVMPNPINIMNTSSFESQEWIDMYKFAVTYRTSKEDIANWLIKNEFKIGIYQVEPNEEIICVDNMMWYFLGASDCGTEIIKVPFMEHPKTKELLEILSKM